jgi:hypothetical protein
MSAAQWKTPLTQRCRSISTHSCLVSAAAGGKAIDYEDTVLLTNASCTEIELQTRASASCFHGGYDNLLIAGFCPETPGSFLPQDSAVPHLCSGLSIGGFPQRRAM